MIRSFQWDLARQVERLDWLLAQLPRYADWGYQELHLHLEDAVAFPSLPGVARRDAYTYRQFARLVDGATRAGIKVVPIVNLLGHTEYLIKVPELRDLNELRATDGSPLEHGQICPLHPRTLEVAEKLLRDMAPFCTAGKVHVGLDESFQLGKHPLSQAEIAEVGLAAHFARYVGKLHGLTQALGLRMGMWADMFYFLPGAIPLLPRGLIAYDWYYYPFHRHPKVELFNFAECDLAPRFRRQGIAYWGCPMNGAFRYEPLPVFGERLANIASWWRRCARVGAEGFLVTSWEADRLALETTTVVDAAAASLWLDPAERGPNALLTRGLRRVFPTAPARSLAGALLAADRRAFAGYARWQINDRWDTSAGCEPLARHEEEVRFFTQLGRRRLPEAFAASVAFRRYLAKRDVFVRGAARGVFRLRRQLVRPAGADRAWLRSLGRLAADAGRFRATLATAELAARRMWTRTRRPDGHARNQVMLRSDTARLAAWTRCLNEIGRDPERVRGATPVCGAWQLRFWVHHFAPALQKIVVEQEQTDGGWREVAGRFTIEFRAFAARRQARIRREFTVPVPVPSPDGRWRIAVRGLGQVAVSGLALSDGIKTLTAGAACRRVVLGQPAPRRGLPSLDWSRNADQLLCVFGEPQSRRSPQKRRPR